MSSNSESVYTILQRRLQIIKETLPKLDRKGTVFKNEKLDVVVSKRDPSTVVEALQSKR